MKKIFFVSIRPRFEDLSALSMDQIFDRLGSNAGNLLFTNAVQRQLRWDEAETGGRFEPATVNEKFDVVVIPAANWLYERFDFAVLASLVEQLTIPVVLIGIGAQAGPERRIPQIPEGTLRLVRTVSERSALIGTRGDFSTEVLDHYGIRNVQAIGCPSLYLTPKGVFNIRRNRNPESILVAGTRYGAPGRDKSPEARRQHALYALAVSEKLYINYQSERPEMDFLLKGQQPSVFAGIEPSTCKYYGVETMVELYDYLREFGRCFVDIDEWIEAMRGFDFYFGSRVHGAISSLLAGTPACLVTHDSRTMELGEFAEIPSMWIEDVGALTRDRLEEISSAIDLDRFERRMKMIYADYVRFLEANGLEHVL